MGVDSFLFSSDHHHRPRGSRRPAELPCPGLVLLHLRQGLVLDISTGASAKEMGNGKWEILAAVRVSKIGQGGTGHR